MLHLHTYFFATISRSLASERLNQMHPTLSKIVLCSSPMKETKLRVHNHSSNCRLQGVINASLRSIYKAIFWGSLTKNENVKLSGKTHNTL